MIVGVAGCHRGYYRRQADAEARLLIREKLSDPRWNQLDPSISVSPESRMHDPFSADHPPVPPDDPASHKLMHCVDGKEGYPHWHANGDTGYISSPDWRSYLPLNAEGVLDLDVDGAVRLSQLHSTTWQEQRETLYLSALDVSLERFGFDTQAFFGFNSFFRTQGRLAPGGSQSSIEITPGPNRTQLTRLTTTGANLAVGIANTIIWNFSGPNTQTASTLIDFSLVQPLLFRAGRDRILESLTLAERTLLANVRQIERFRRGFFLSIVTGRSPGAGPNLGGNFLAEPAGANFNAGGYLGLLLSQQQIRIAEFNVQSLQNVLDQFRAFFVEERIDLLQVRQAENTLYDAQASLLGAKVDYEDSLDQFKRDLGLPPDVPVRITDPLLSSFELIDDQLLARQLEIAALREEIGEQLELINPYSIIGEELEAVEWSDELRQRLENLRPWIERFSPLIADMEEADVALLRDDFAKLLRMRRERLKKLASLQAAIEASDIQYDIEPSILRESEVESSERLNNELTDLLGRFADVKRSIALIEDSIERIIVDGPGLTADELRERLNDEILLEAPEILTRIANVAIELTLLQARARVDSITLPDIDLNAEAALAIALQFRRDLMNARASLVDRWRRIEFVADDLESTLDVIFEGSVGSVGDNPFRIRGENNRFGMGLRFDAPITRLSERNAYRQALIEYQQARRSYYNFEDAVNQNLRRTIRTIEQNKVLFELNRRSIRTAIQQVELAQLSLIEPVEPGFGGGGGGGGLGPTAANDLTRALDALQRAQTDFVTIWVRYEVLRRGLDFDLGTMQLTPDGVWLDPGTINVTYAWRAAAAVGILPEEICLPPDIGTRIDLDQYGAAPDQETTDTGVAPFDDETGRGDEKELEPQIDEPREVPAIPPSLDDIPPPPPPANDDIGDAGKLRVEWSWCSDAPGPTPG